MHFLKDDMQLLSQNLNYFRILFIILRKIFGKYTYAEESFSYYFHIKDFQHQFLAQIGIIRMKNNYKRKRESSNIIYRIIYFEYKRHKKREFFLLLQHHYNKIEKYYDLF